MFNINGPKNPKPSPEPWWKDTIIGVLAHPSAMRPAFEKVIDIEPTKPPRKLVVREKK